MASGALVGRGNPTGRWLFLAIWLGTLIWAVWGVGLNWLQLVPRVEAQNSVLPAPGQTASGNDNDWQTYGGTLAGRRYSALADITPANVDRLELAWTQRTGGLPVAAETEAHKREYHSEATPIHIGDTLFTCTPHSFVQAIDATTGRTRWSWHENATV